MQSRNYTATIVVAQTPGVVLSHISDVTKWWSKDFEGRSAKLNDEFVICHLGRHYSKQKLVELIPGNKVVWLVTESNLDWIEDDKTEWTGTKMIFELTSEGQNTLIHFTHEGLVPEKECYSRCSQGWDTVIKEGLYKFITDDARK